MRLLLLSLVLLLGAAIAQAQDAKPAAEPAKSSGIRKVELRGLNKVTARVSTLEGRLGEELEFGKLTIVVSACWTAPADKQPEHAALIEITEDKPETGPTTVFSGWMFASSPTLSALEHPVYDISVIACRS